MATTKPDIPLGCHVRGKAVGDFELRSFKSKSGRDITLIEGMVLAGQSIIKVTQSLAPNETPNLMRDGEEVIAPVVPHYSDDGLIKVNVRLTRPELAS